jgi:hypothetical protein
LQLKHFVMLGRRMKPSSSVVTNANSERLEGICRIDSRTTILSYRTKGGVGGR